MNPDDYYVSISGRIFKDKKVSDGGKLFYLRLCEEFVRSGYSEITNNEYAEIYNVTTRTIIRWLHELTEGKYIKCTFDRSKMLKKRKIFPYKVKYAFLINS